MKFEYRGCIARFCKKWQKSWADEKEFVQDFAKNPSLAFRKTSQDFGRNLLI
ncbi:MAG: hypothetical protein Q4P20_07675 [Eubacteriales bacterium]|nr:hypothetical protein [Eubacteriales bacterium]